MTMRNALLRWIPSLLVMAVIFTLSSLPASRIPHYGKLDLLLKKGGHALGYGLLALSYAYALPPWLSSMYRNLTALLMAVLFAMSDEYHQSFVEGRNSSAVDILIDSLGAAFALLVSAVYSSNSSSKSAN
jgi:VanZ family protein